MGSMLKFDSERRELVRERRNARIERKLERRQARERKHSQTADVPSAPSATQVLAERELRSAVDRIVIDALDRHERIAPPATPPAASTRLPDTPEPEPARTAALPAGWRRGAGAARVAPRARPRRVPGASPPDARGGARRGPPADRAGRGAGVGRRRVRGARAPGGRAVERGARAARGGDRDRADRRGRRRRPASHVGDQPRRGADVSPPGPARPGARAGGVRGVRGHRAAAADRAQERPARPPDAADAVGSPARVLALRARGELRTRTAVDGRARADAPRAPRRRFGRPTPREEVP